MNGLSVTSRFDAASSALSRGLSSTKQWLFGDKGLTFRDLLVIVIPMQLIPGVSQVYRKLTGDGIKPAMALAGGALFGGPIGAAMSAVGLALESGAEVAQQGADASALAVTVSPPGRGGWLMNAAGAVHTPPPVSLSATLLAAREARGASLAQAERRGGWMLAAAYAPADAHRAASALHETA
jgi:hypothetical protein